MTRLLADAHIPHVEEYLPEGVVLERFDRAPDEAALLRADALLVRTVTRVDAALLAAAPHVRVVGSATAGYDHVDPDACSAAGVRFAYAPGCNAGAVGDYVAAVAGPARRGLASIAVVGCGHAGGAAERRLRALGWRTVPYDPPRGLPATWDEVLACDAVTFHVPLTRGGTYGTHGLVDEAVFRRARWQMLIQAARGGVVDEPALKAWIRRGGRAHVDVWVGEPDADPELIALAHTATPHIAGYSVQAKRRATEMVLQAMGLWDAGTMGLWDFGTLGPWDSGSSTPNPEPQTSDYLKQMSSAWKANPGAETFLEIRNTWPLRSE